MKMRHPDIDGEAPAAEVTEEAFEEVWSEKGWVKVEEDTTPVAPPNPFVNQQRGDV